MSQDTLFPIIGALGWLIVAGAALASYRLQWSQVIKMALVWLLIFTGGVLIVSWLM